MVGRSKRKPTDEESDVASKKKKSAVGESNVHETKKNKAASTSVEEPGPFGFVFYTSDQTKGVVETKNIAKKDRLVGSKCKAPMPIDMVLEEKLTPSNQQVKYEAFVVQFGSKLRYSYMIDYI